MAAIYIYITRFCFKIERQFILGRQISVPKRGGEPAETMETRASSPFPISGDGKGPWWRKKKKIRTEFRMHCVQQVWRRTAAASLTAEQRAFYGGANGSQTSEAGEKAMARARIVILIPIQYFYCSSHSPRTTSLGCD